MKNRAPAIELVRRATKTSFVSGTYDTLSGSARAYLAGFLDRSCFIGIIRYTDQGRPKYTVRINVQCSNRQTLKPLCVLVGGSIQERGETFIWSLAGRQRCAELLNALTPHLHVRKKAAEKVIQFNSEWTRLSDPDDASEILARRDQFVQESVGLKMSWRKECSAPVKRVASSSE